MSEPTLDPRQNPPVRGGVVPHIVVGDAAAAADFYKRAFAAEEVQRLPAEDGRRLMHCHLYINGGSLMLCDAFPEHGYGLEKPQSFTLHLHVANVDKWWQRALDAGATVAMPLERQFWGDRYGQILDPYGIRWSLAETPE